MRDDFHCSFTTSPGSFSGHWKKSERFLRQDSNIAPCWLVLAHTPALGGGPRVGVEVLSLVEAAEGGATKEMPRLQAAFAALKPLLLEYRTSLLELDMARKSPADSRAIDVQRFLSTWLESRVLRAFDHVIHMPIKDMAKAALSFKPTATQSFVEDIADNANIIKLIPESDLTPAICARAIAKSGSALYYVPGRLRSRELALQAVSSSGLCVLAHVPMGMRDEEMCAAALRADGLNLKHVPPVLRTPELCALACAHNAFAWSFVPVHSRIPEVEYCLSMHGVHVKTADTIYREVAATDPVRAEAMFNDANMLYVSLHHSKCDEFELADLGLVPVA